jgi:hypothetical protein
MRFIIRYSSGCFNSNILLCFFELFRKDFTKPLSSWLPSLLAPLYKRMFVSLRGAPSTLDIYTSIASERFFFSLDSSTLPLLSEFSPFNVEGIKRLDLAFTSQPFCSSTLFKLLPPLCLLVTSWTRVVLST